MAPAATSTCQDVTIPVIPELYDPNFLDVLLPKDDAPPVPAKVQEPSHPMIDALKASVNRTRTTNNDPAYASTLSATLDAFQALKPHYFDTKLHHILADAWAEDPALTLRIIWNSRSIHDGKGDRNIFYQAFGWLYQNHPRTAIQNLDMLVRKVCKIKNGYAPHGYWKDLTNIVALAAVGELGPRRCTALFLHAPKMQPKSYSKEKRTPEEAVAAVAKEKVAAREKRVEKNARFHSVLLQQLQNPRFRALYIAVARLFAVSLAEDMSLVDKAGAMEHGRSRSALLRQISLAGKWAPTPGKSHDRVTNLSSAISLLLFHSQSTSSLVSPFPISFDTSALPHDTHVLRTLYQRNVLTCLRGILACPEPLMSSNRWSEIAYNRVPSMCMERNLPNFYKHDTARFEQYLADVENGTTKISGATLMPHTLLASVMECRRGSDTLLKTSLKSVPDLKQRIIDAKVRGIEAQWKVMVERIGEAGALDNCLAVCDVSGSMGHIWSAQTSGHVAPIILAIALTLVLSELARPPFANKFITFSANPHFEQVNPADSLFEKITQMASAAWSMNTAFDKVFLDLLLPLAIANNLKQEDMIKRLFVFTDMQFDAASRDGASAWETSHEFIERKFKDAGYELPEIVYWNLSLGADTFPVTHDKPGVALMNGFSPAMLKMFMGEETEEGTEEEWDMVKPEPVRQKVVFDPVSIMIKAVSRPSYSGLIVVD